MALKDSWNWRVVAKPVTTQGPKTVSEKAKQLSDTCLLNAEAIDKGMLPEERKTLLKLDRAWCTESNGQFYVAVSVAPGIPLAFVKGITKKNNSVAVRNAKEASGLYRDIANALTAGELNAEIETAMAEASKVAVARQAKAKKNKSK